MFDDLYCKIYVNSDKNIDEFSKDIEKIIPIKQDEFYSFEGEKFTLDVLRNKDYDKVKCNEFPNGFLFFKFNLETNCAESEVSEYIKFVSSLISSLWRLGMKVVASCDFEEVLPNQGGYNKRINY